MLLYVNLMLSQDTCFGLTVLAVMTRVQDWRMETGAMWLASKVKWGRGGLHVLIESDLPDLPLWDALWCPSDSKCDS